MLVYRSVPDNYQLWLDIQNLLGGWWGWISLIIRNHSLWGITMSATIVSDHMIGEYRVSAVWTLEWDNLMQASPSRRWFSCNGETHYTMSPFIHFQGCYLSWKKWWKFKKTNLRSLAVCPWKKSLEEDPASFWGPIPFSAMSWPFFVIPTSPRWGNMFNSPSFSWSFFCC